MDRISERKSEGMPVEAMRADAVSFSYGESGILDGVCLSIKKGEITTILGANGCGKSTLFFLMTKELQTDSGNIYLYDENLRRIPLKEFSKKISIVQQNNHYISGITVKELVKLGRTPYRRPMRGGTQEDEQKVDWAMEVTGMTGYADRDISRLSGGQRQRAWIAMALAQDTKVLFLDEPTTFLDIKYQLEILDLVKALNQKHDMTIVMVLHDINQAIHYSDTIIGMKNGRVEVCGPPDEVITENTIESLYGLRLRIVDVEGEKVVLNV